METFCLKWQNFEFNLSSAFQELRDDSDFYDVTLACGDRHVEAHKVILSACSSFFRDLLKKYKHPHPLVYLKGVKYSEIVSLLNFIYQGEVNVAQEDLSSFLAVAEELKVKGLTKYESMGSNLQTNNSPKNNFSKKKDKEQHKLPQLKRARSSNEGASLPVVSAVSSVTASGVSPAGDQDKNTENNLNFNVKPDPDGSTNDSDVSSCIIVPQTNWDSNLLKDDIADQDDNKATGWSKLLINLSTG